MYTFMASEHNNKEVIYDLINSRKSYNQTNLSVLISRQNNLCGPKLLLVPKMINLNESEHRLSAI